MEEGKYCLSVYRSHASLVVIKRLGAQVISSDLRPVSKSVMWSGPSRREEMKICLKIRRIFKKQVNLFYNLFLETKFVKYSL